MARLKNVKPSKNFRDETWLPEDAFNIEYDSKGYITKRPARSSGRSVLTNPENYLGFSHSEKKLIEKGLGAQEVLFLRALKRWENTSYIQKYPDERK